MPFVQAYVRSFHEGQVTVRLRVHSVSEDGEHVDLPYSVGSPQPREAVNMGVSQCITHRVAQQNVSQRTTSQVKYTFVLHITHDEKAQTHWPPWYPTTVQPALIPPRYSSSHPTHLGSTTS